MQAVKEKLHDMSARRKAKADARAEEKAEKDLAKARAEIAHEVRLAKEAEAEMDLHVAKASEMAEDIAKHSPRHPNTTESSLAAAGGSGSTSSYRAPAINQSL